MDPKKKIGLVSLGCPKNLVDSEIMLGLLPEDIFEITNEKEDAEVLIVNTCGFIESAKQESVNTILEMARCKQDKCRVLIVTGCLAERYREEILKEIPEVDAVAGTGNYGEIADIIDRACRGEKRAYYGKLTEIDYLRNKRVVSTRKGSAYLKIAEGCDNACTYCVIPSLRGRFRSRTAEDILEEAKTLVESGSRELILVAQDTTRYGLDLYGERKLVELLQKLEEIPALEWIRLLYCYPEEIDGRLIKELQRNSKLCKYLDIPIQHISDKILKAMGRRGRHEDIRRLLTDLRAQIPGIMLRTSLIVGFPGEDAEDFTALYEFVREYKFDRLGVFSYSKEENTPAAGMKPQVNKKIKQERNNALMALQRDISEAKGRARLNKEYKTIVEGISEDGIFYYGRTYAEAPDIDGVVYFTSSEPLESGRFVTIRILNTEDYDLIGEVVHESSQ